MLQVINTTLVWPQKKGMSQKRESKANISHFDVPDCMNHEKIIYGRMRISLEKEHKLRMIMGDRKITRMINLKGIKRVKSNG